MRLCQVTLQLVMLSLQIFIHTEIISRAIGIMNSLAYEKTKDYRQSRRS